MRAGSVCWSMAQKKYLIAFTGLLAVILGIATLSLRVSYSVSARDFEECVEALGAGSSADQSSQSSSEERGVAMTSCSTRFAGRRKAGGGYTYNDFMQGRNFDIAGPNPTAEERKQIDREYIAFLDAQREEAVSAELAKKQDERLRAELEIARQPAGPPLVLTPKKRPAPVAKHPLDRSKSTHCCDDSLACGWSKLSDAVRDAFALSPKAKP
jgi:hypothetical protein